jgi:hypothetical protein
MGQVSSIEKERIKQETFFRKEFDELSNSIKWYLQEGIHISGDYFLVETIRKLEIKDYHDQYKYTLIPAINLDIYQDIKILCNLISSNYDTMIFLRGLGKNDISDNVRNTMINNIEQLLNQITNMLK